MFFWFSTIKALYFGKTFTTVTSYLSNVLLVILLLSTCEKKWGKINVIQKSLLELNNCRIFQYLKNKECLFLLKRSGFFDRYFNHYLHI